MALYHKHRPQLFGTIIGQEHIVTTLTNQLRTNTVAHAYLFSGPRGVGKTTTARILAKAINCQNRASGTPEPCDQCESCKDITKSRSIDVIEIDAASHTGVDNVRENIIDNAQFQPTKSAFKVFIIDEVHMLSASAFNALLKTIEEPPKHVIFILATTDREKLPDTIISRCQRFTFKKIPIDKLLVHLNRIAEGEGVRIVPDVVRTIIQKSDGCARDAISLLDQVIAIGEKNITPETAALILPTSSFDDVVIFVTGLVRHDQAMCLSTISSILDRDLSVVQFTDDVVDILRTLLVIVASPEYANSIENDLSPKAHEELVILSKNTAIPTLINLIDLVMKRRLEIKTSPIPQFPLELIAIEWCTGPNSGVGSVVGTPTEKKADRQSSQESSLINPSTEEKKTIVERVKEFVSGDPLTIEQARTAWERCIKICETESPALVFVLKMTSLTNVDGHTIQLSVPYTFHRDKMLEKNSLHRLHQILEKESGTKVSLDITVEERVNKDVSKDIQDIANIFGGEVVGT